MSSLPLSESERSTSVTTVLDWLRKPRNSQTFNDDLTKIIHATNYSDFAEGLQGEEAIAFINILDKALPSLPQDSELSQKCLRSLRKMCSQARTLPTSHMLSDGLEKTGDIPAASGMFADVWTGTYNGRTVALKAFRIYNNEDLRIVQKQLCKEVVLWRRLSHPNVLPLLGVSETVFRLSLVSDWMPNGNIMDYLAKNPGAVRLPLLDDVCKGMEYLHSKLIVHGNMKGHNILINSSRKACISDFGLASITSDPLSFNASTVGATHGSARWMAPELLDPEKDTTRPTKESDMYALAMTMLEIFTGTVPFPDYRNQTVIFRVMEGQRPEKPQNAADIGLSDQVWSLMGSCWVHDPSQRLKIPEVVHKFTRIFKRATREESGPKPPLPPKDGNDALRKASGGVPPLPNKKPNTKRTIDYPPVTSLQRVQSPPVIAAPARDVTVVAYNPPADTESSCCRCCIQ